LKLCLDVETTIKNKGHVFTPENRLISYAFILGQESCNFVYYNDPGFVSCGRDAVDRSTEFIGFNCKFDLHWLRRKGIVLPVGCKIWDCQLAEFILNNQVGAYGSLNDALSSYGIPLKPDLVAEYWAKGVSTEDIPIPILEEYNKYDVTSTMELYIIQQQLMTDKQKALVYILGEDLKTLLDAEFNGIKWDADKANKKTETLYSQIYAINAALTHYLPPINFGKFNWDSGDCLSALIYGGRITFDYSIPGKSIYKSGPHKGEEYTKNRWYTETVEFVSRFKPLEGTELKKTALLPQATTRFYQSDEPTLAQLKSKDKQSVRLLDLLRERSKLIKIVLSMDNVVFPSKGHTLLINTLNHLCNLN